MKNYSVVNKTLSLRRQICFVFFTFFLSLSRFLAAAKCLDHNRFSWPLYRPFSRPWFLPRWWQNEVRSLTTSSPRVSDNSLRTWTCLVWVSVGPSPFDLVSFVLLSSEVWPRSSHFGLSLWFSFFAFPFKIQDCFLFCVFLSRWCLSNRLVSIPLTFCVVSEILTPTFLLLTKYDVTKTRTNAGWTASFTDIHKSHDAVIYKHSGYGKYSDHLKFFTLCCIAAIF